MVRSDSFRKIADHLVEVVWLVDASFEEVLYINPAYETLAGAYPPEADRNSMAALRTLHEHDQHEFSDWLASIRADIEAGDLSEEYTIDIRIERPDGDVRWAETVAVPIQDDDGTITGLAGITTDHTDRVEREQELEATVERLDEFASMLSHDLRNPISIARGQYELYQETENERHLAAVGEAVERIEDLTMDLTTLARHGTFTADPEPVDLTTVAERAWTAIDDRDATLELNDATLTGDDGQLQALFENLFRNAVGHGGDDVTVRVGPLDAGADSNVTGFYVEDTGPGIPEENRESVFEHGFTTGYGGSGVGLTIVGRIADGHDLSVSLTESPEGGARFEFTPESGVTLHSKQGG